MHNSNATERQLKPCRSDVLCDCFTKRDCQQANGYAPYQSKGGGAAHLSALPRTLWKAFKSSSGYRSEALNKAIGGSSKSQHSKGEALDMQSTKGYTNKELFMYIKDHLTFDQLIGEFPDNVGEYAWVHCSYKKEGNRGEVLIAYKDDNNKTKYAKW